MNAAAQLSPGKTMSMTTTTTTMSSISGITSSSRSTTRNLSNTPPPLIVRALYDYHSPDSTNLSFQAGTLIRVLTQLQSGWWDGCIDGERGWFPCNFVTEVDGNAFPEDLEDAGFLDTNDSDSSVASGDEDIGERALVGGDTDDEIMLSSQEFTWVPRADKEGRTFFLNTQNGETSWELPNSKVFLDDWDESILHDDDGPRSSMDSENSEEILMLGPIEEQQQQQLQRQPESFTVPDFNVLPFKELSLIIASLYSVGIIEGFVSYKDQFRSIDKTSLAHTYLPFSTTCPYIRYFQLIPF